MANEERNFRKFRGRDYKSQDPRKNDKLSNYTAKEKKRKFYNADIGMKQKFAAHYFKNQAYVNPGRR